LPSSSSHALIGGYAGAAVAKAGFAAIIVAGWTKTLVFIVLSPLIGLAAGWFFMVMFYQIFQHASPSRVDAIFKRLQLLSAALFSLSHGANDAQKTMGIIVGLLVSSRAALANETGWMRYLYIENADTVPYWVEIGAYSAIALGTLFGGWRIVHTMGSRITKLRPVGGCAAETGGSLAILIATRFGIPVSTTHTITGAIMGVGATTRLSAVRWGVAGRIVWAWVLTIPAAATMSALALWMLEVLHPS
jgi:PiT family inorganic phosphate transporter